MSGYEFEPEYELWSKQCEQFHHETPENVKERLARISVDYAKTLLSSVGEEHNPVEVDLALALVGSDKPSIMRFAAMIAGAIEMGYYFGRRGSFNYLSFLPQEQPQESEK